MGNFRWSGSKQYGDKTFRFGQFPREIRAESQNTHEILEVSRRLLLSNFHKTSRQTHCSSNIHMTGHGATFNLTFGDFLSVVSLAFCWSSFVCSYASTVNAKHANGAVRARIMFTGAIRIVPKARTSQHNWSHWHSVRTFKSSFVLIVCVYQNYWLTLYQACTVVDPVFAVCLVVYAEIAKH